ncbi:DUF6519 domain-containing protein, partial [Enhygromyxa salina]|uniref:DUF6519 domain-containing protein n=1 Tax=Enhygromyxa salina TaxID=215803 RepID=UPI001969EE0C
MATQDISRFLLQPKKHYSSVHLQQGRVIVDSDWNERAGIVAEDFRQSVLDIACSKGTPNDGFRLTTDGASVSVAMPLVANHLTYDFQVGDGSYYIGGLRLAVDLNAGYETFLGQTDWLQVDSLTANMPDEFGEADRVDLVYVYAWEQPVTAIEDSELREVALGGRDTSVRIKRMRRFMVRPDVGSADCDVAFPLLITDLEDGGKASYDAATGELRSSALLTVTTNSSSDDEDLCADPVTAGYVGAQNQTIRVELRDDGDVSGFVWGFDNASPLYRVKVNGDRVTVSFLTEPADAAALPRAGQVVEILQWGAKLPNDEKVAEAEGFLTTVATSYDPQTKELTLSDQITDGWLEWLAEHEVHWSDRDAIGEQDYLYLRVWDRGGDVTSTPIIECGVDDPQPLGNIGLTVTLNAVGKPGDYWIIAARPSTPDVVTPWDLDDTVSGGVAPHGPRRFFAPLATVSWDTEPDPSEATVHDCRTRLRRLCEGGCCTVTVGDGKTSHGQVSSLQDAVDMVQAGGKICILPGEYEDHANLTGCANVTIEGCGPRTIIRNPAPTTDNLDFTVFEPPVFKIDDCTGVVIKDLTIIAYSSVGVEIVDGEGAGECKQISLENLTIVADGNYFQNGAGVTNWRLPAPAITVAAATEVEIVNCDISNSGAVGFSYLVVLGGDTMSMRGCSVTVPADAEAGGALGGVNI